MKKENRTILYYPTITIPSNNWLRHSILYWDKISSIVPESVDEDEILSYDIKYLIDEGQFAPVRPDILVSSEKGYLALQAFEKEFMSVIESEAFQRYVNGSSFSLYKVRKDKVPVKPMQRIHTNKTTYQIHEYLVEKGLALRNEFDGWFLFERNTALLYMSLLAKYLADIAQNQTSIGTDRKVYERFNFSRITANEVYPVININISRLLPTPKPNIPFETLIDFKKKRRDNLLRFRKILMDFQSKLSNSESRAEYKEHITAFKEQIEIGIKDLTDVMQDAKIETFFKSMKSMIQIKSPSIWIGGAAIADHFIESIDIPITIKSLGIAVTGAVEVSQQYVELRNKLNAIKRDSPFAYLYLAQREGIIKRSN